METPSLRRLSNAATFVQSGKAVAGSRGVEWGVNWAQLGPSQATYAIWPRSRPPLQTQVRVAGFPDPMGIQVYLVEAAGRGRSHPHMARFSVLSESRGACVLCT